MEQITKTNNENKYNVTDPVYVIFFIAIIFAMIKLLIFIGAHSQNSLWLALGGFVCVAIIAYIMDRVK